MDERDHAWVERKRKGRKSDALLSCPACFTTLCLDCQRYTINISQYLWMHIIDYWILIRLWAFCAAMRILGAIQWMHFSSDLLNHLKRWSPRCLAWNPLQNCSMCRCDVCHLLPWQKLQKLTILLVVSFKIPIIWSNSIQILILISIKKRQIWSFELDLISYVHISFWPCNVMLPDFESSKRSS